MTPSCECRHFEAYLQLPGFDCIPYKSELRPGSQDIHFEQRCTPAEDRLAEHIGVDLRRKGSLARWDRGWFRPWHEDPSHRCCEGMKDVRMWVDGYDRTGNRNDRQWRNPIA